MPKIPLSTYRVQLHAGFTLQQLHEQLDYLHQLGIDWIYASPVLAAEPGSTHGYDVINCNVLNPELGTTDHWQRLHAKRKSLGMGWLQDIVPNHMAYSIHNPWIQEVLTHGEASTVAKHFDIDWRHPKYRGKIMLPILGSSLDEAISSGQVHVDAEAQQVRVYEQSLPMSARSLSKLAAGERNPEVLLAAQHYALTYWKSTHSEINYRRFFTVNGLICLRQERRETFAATHALILNWIKAGDIDGLRLDHIDGLLHPSGYLKELRQAAGEDTYIVVEKILEHGETIAPTWPIQGTTGYDFLAYSNQLLRYLPKQTAEQIELDELIYSNKKWVLQHRMAGELDNLLHHASGALAGLPLGMDRELLKETIADWLSGFPVYRAYPSRGRFKEDDRQLMVAAVDEAKRLSPANARGLDLLRAWLRSITTLDEKTATFLQRAMQLSGPLMAKGIEDTTFYQHFDYLACNEVGDNPSPSYSLSISEFHDRMAERSLTTMNASSTHDTKRGEDARARLHTLSALPTAWAAYFAAGEARIAALDLTCPGDIHKLLLQTFVGSYTGEVSAADIDRHLAFAEKALREGKVHSNWSENHADNEAAVAKTVATLLADRDFLDLLGNFVAQIEPLAYLNTLRFTVLKACAPGLSDYYQGAEYFDRSLVDPDNRRPVDYQARRASLEQEDTTKGKAAHKQQLIQRLLHARRDSVDVWQQGSYVPLSVTGPRAEQVLAFRRVFGDDSALVLVAVRTDPEEAWPRGDYFADTYITVPGMGLCKEIVFGGQRAIEGRLPLAELLAHGPVAVYQAVG